MSASSRRVSRRHFIRTTAAASAVFAVPAFVPRSAFGANERVVLGHIGVKNRGMQNLTGFKYSAAAICDVDANVLAAAAKTLEEKGTKAAVYSDYRKLLERKDIDAVVISTPDHWHALQTIDACRAGKDVYCEKPLTLCVAEGRKMVEVARKTGRIVQTGTQQRSDKRFRQACELVRNGRLGKVHTVLVGIPGPNHATTPAPDSDPPSELDYDFWLGPAPERPYNVNRVHYNFRFFWDYSGGQMTNFGAHHIDIAHWALGMDASGPTAVKGEATYPEDPRLCEVSKTCRVELSYANLVGSPSSTNTTVIVAQGDKSVPGGVTFVGDKGRIFVDRSKIMTDKPELVKEPLSADAERLYVSENHYQNFLDCIASRELPVADIEIGHRTATACHIANIATRLRPGAVLHWDPVAERFDGDDEANAMLMRPYRAPWKLA